MFQPFPPIFHLISGSRSTIQLSPLTPAHSPSKRFHEIALHSQKKLKKIQEIVKKAYHDKALVRTQLYAIIKGEVGEWAAVAAAQRILTAKVSIGDIAAEVENNRRESVMKFAEDHDVLAKTVHATLHNDLPLSRSRPCEQSNCFTRDEEGAIQNVIGDHSNDRHGFLTILDNVLTVGGSARGEERSCRPQPQSGGHPEGAGEGMKNGAAANFAEALWRW